VLEVFYLLFNEGYSLCARDFSDEAIRLTRLLVANPATALPKCHALLSLMLLQSARDAARIDADGSLVLLRDQRRALWDRQRIEHGMRELDLAAAGQELTRYHLEAFIASKHSLAESWEVTDWISISDAYESLESIYPSPVIRLNRAVAVSQIYGAEAGLDLLSGLDQQLSDYLPFHATKGYFWQALQDPQKASQHYRQAQRLCRTKAETAYFHTLLTEIGSFQAAPTSFDGF
jgi:RNA polymerase sigma-70 factor, ECF subfamily